jgi:hypothetical protein
MSLKHSQADSLWHCFFYKTRRNLVASVAYHSANIVLGNGVLWVATPAASFVLAVELLINIALIIIVTFLPIIAMSNKKIMKDEEYY